MISMTTNSLEFNYRSICECKSRNCTRMGDTL